MEPLFAGSFLNVLLGRKNLIDDLLDQDKEVMHCQPNPMSAVDTSL